MDYKYRFPAVQGVQAGRKFYIGMVPLGMLSILFPTDDEYVAPEFRAQRKLNETRIPVIRDYIINNRNNYVFSALAASIDGEFSFISESDNSTVGVLEVPMDAKFLLNDGQHRKAAIFEAIREDESLKSENIPVVFFKDLGLQRSQQMFTDLNKHAVKTSNSIAELYDSRDEMAVITRRAVSAIEFLDTYTDKEKDNLGKYSSNLFTLNTFYTANKTIIGGGKIQDCDYDFIFIYWSLVVRHMVQWNELNNHKLTKTDLRENYIATQGVVIQALGRVGRYFYGSGILEKRDALIELENINWKRSAPHWKMRAINEKGRIITNKKAIMLISNYIKARIGVPLTDEEKREEKAFKALYGNENK